MLYTLGNMYQQFSTINNCGAAKVSIIRRFRTSGTFSGEFNLAVPAW